MDKKLYLLICLLVTMPGKSLSQTPKWISTYNGPSSGVDAGFDCAIDNQGNLFVVGGSDGTNTQFKMDFVIIKYNASSGDTIWTRRYNSAANRDDEAFACVLDSSGNLIVAGYSSNGTNDDFVIVKYNASSGDTIWTKRYNGAANEGDHARDCSLDGSGNLYVTGRSNNGVSHDYLTIKYASSGDTIWTRRYDGTANGDDVASGCAVDASGNIYVTGYSYNGADYNLLTIKYASNGDTIWTRRSDDTLDSLEIFASLTDCAVDSSSNVYVTGMCGTQANWGNRYGVTIKYDSLGSVAWTNIYDSPSNYDQPFGCALDSWGHLYVCGTSYSGLNDDYLIIKYNAVSGDTLWTTRYNGTSDNGDYALSCAFDASGNLYVTGATEIDSSDFDCLTIKYASQSPTLLQAFRASMLSGAIHLVWEVIEDRDIAGYLIYRQTREGFWKKLLPTPIPAERMEKYELLDQSAEVGKRYKYRLSFLTHDGEERILGEAVAMLSAPSVLALWQNTPNPFNPRTTISFSLPEACAIDLSIYDLEGRRVAKIYHGPLGAGVFSRSWDGRNDRGEPVSSGMYIYQLRAGKRRLSRKMLLLR